MKIYLVRYNWHSAIVIAPTAEKAVEQYLIDSNSIKNCNPDTDWVEVTSINPNVALAPATVATF